MTKTFNEQENQNSVDISMFKVISLIFYLIYFFTLFLNNRENV